MLDTTSPSSEPEGYSVREQLLNEVKSLASPSNRSSASLSDIEIPLLPEATEQQGLPFSALHKYGAYAKSRTMGLSLSSLFKEGWMYAKKVFLPKQKHQSQDGRHVKVDVNRTKTLIDERTGKPYVGNWIRSNKYTPWTFVPRQVLAQFSKLANFYFLCFAIMQLVPGLSTIGNSTNIIPLMIFVSISMAKEGFDDYRRHRLDKKENKRETFVIDSAAPFSAGALNWRKGQWRYLRVGDIIKVHRDDPIPADIVLLGSTSLGQSRVTYVETIALDGETNLKMKQTVKSVAEACATPEKLIACSVEFVTQDPNSNLSTFKGRVVVNDQASPLTNDNVIYRGSILRNTSEVTAMIVYSGEECKIRLNASGNRHTHIKAPRLQFMLNKIVILVVCIVIGLSIYNTLAYQFWKSEVEVNLFYLSSAVVPLHEEIFGFIIMFATMVPLSLYVTMEMIKLAQIFFLNADVDMYDEKSNTPFEARTSAINEELGQVTHILSDKTGTLTDNEMKFRRFCVAGTEWVHDDTEAPPQAAKWSPSSPSIRSLKPQPMAERKTGELVQYLSKKPKSAFASRARLMLLCMALCHSCVPETMQDGTTIDFRASSPDELALARAAQQMGFLMRSRDHKTVTLELSSSANASSKVERYEVLAVIDFSTQRKRMSVVVRFPDGKICVICKGADSAILERLKLPGNAAQKNAGSQRRDEHVEQKWSSRRPGADDSTARQATDIASGNGGTNLIRPADMDLASTCLHPRRSVADDAEIMSAPSEISVEDSRSVIEHCIGSINNFANESLRTLLYAYRFLDEKEYADWKKIWETATTSLFDHEKMIESAAELVEVNFELAGATAIEDKLQQGVSESIDKLCRANIKIWMITGDKRETAINIGHSCGLVKGHSITFTLDDRDGTDDMEELIISLKISILRTAAHSVVVVEGHTLATIYNEPSGLLETIFFDLIVLADSVICCRAQPEQKAQLVSTIRKRVPNSVTLAIGDGANDIAMIQEAHIGIGLTGKEGLQAARSSDYSIAQFRFLPKLLLVHGRWNYVRTCKYVLGTLWKEVVFFLTQALFQRWNGFTGTSLYEPWSLAAFNTLFTSLPVLVIGIFEKDLAASTLLAVPELYKSMGPKNGGFSFWIYFGWTTMAVADSMIVYFGMLNLFGNAETTRDNTLFSMGDLDFVAVILIISMKLQTIEMHNKSIVALLSFFLSAGAPFFWNILLASAYPPTTPYRVRGAFFDGFGRNPTWWMTLTFIVVCVYMLEVSVSACRKALFPTDTDVFQKLEHDVAHKEWFEAAATAGSRNNRNRYTDEPVVARNGVDIPLQDLSRGG